MFCTQIVFDLLYNMTCIRALNYEGQQCPTLKNYIIFFLFLIFFFLIVTFIELREFVVFLFYVSIPPLRTQNIKVIVLPSLENR